MKEDPKDYIVPIRMSLEEKEKIKLRAEKTGGTRNARTRITGRNC